MIRQIDLDDLKRRLATMEENSTFCLVGGGNCPCHYALDIDWLHDLVKMADSYDKAIEDAYDNGYKEGQEDGHHRGYKDGYNTALEDS